jgi:hypothetical protein
VEADDGGGVDGVQHYPAAVGGLAGGLEELGHVAVLAGQGEFPSRKHVVEFLVPALPLLDVLYGAYVDGSFQEDVDLG